MIGVVLFDYDDNDLHWHSVNDDVIDEVSKSTVSTEPEAQRLTSSGNLSLGNNGGLASIRLQWASYDLGTHDGLALRVGGDGNIYLFRIRTEESGTEISYTALFETEIDA